MLGILASIIDGVLVGLVYGLAAMGLTLIWGVMDVINLTHGAMIVAGMMALYLLANALGISPYLTLPPILVGGFFVGVALYWVAIHRMVGRPPLMSLLSTFAVNLILIGIGTAVWGTALFNVEVSLPGITVGRYTFPGAHILAAVLAAVIAALLYLFLHYTRIGKAMRAVANNREAAELVGIPTTRLLAISVGVGVALYWIAVHRMVGRPPLMSLLSTFAVNLVLIGIGTGVWGTALFNVAVSLPGVSLGRYTFPGAHILAAVLAAVIAASLYLFLHRTRLGKAVRAVANNREAAELVGIPTTRVLAVTVGCGVALAGVSGVLIGTLFPFTVLSGDGYQLKGFVVTVLGGFGNPVGALLGGVALGLLEGAVTPFVPVSWTLVIEFALFVLVLIAFPGGIFASRRGAL